MESYKLSRYSIDKMIFLELTRKIIVYAKIQKGKRKLGLKFPISIGEGKMVTFPCLKAAKRSSDELHFFHLPLYPKMFHVDPYKKITSIVGSKY